MEKKLLRTRYGGHCVNIILKMLFRECFLAYRPCFLILSCEAVQHRDKWPLIGIFKFLGITRYEYANACVRKRMAGNSEQGWD